MKKEKCEICGRAMLVYGQRDVYICSRCEETVLVEDYGDALMFKYEE